jgi:hypothetical protein
MYVYVRGTGSGIPVPVVFFNRNRTSPPNFLREKKESNRNSCGSPVHCGDTNSTSTVLGTYLIFFDRQHINPPTCGDTNSTSTVVKKSQAYLRDGGLVEFLCCGDTLLGAAKIGK